MKPNYLASKHLKFCLNVLAVKLHNTPPSVNPKDLPAIVVLGETPFHQGVSNRC